MADLKVGVGGVWKQVSAVKVGVSGAWKDVWDAIRVQLSNFGGIRVVIDPATATSTIYFNSDGTYGANTTPSSGTWLVAGAASAYEVRMSPTSGTFTTGTTGSWLSCGSDHTWTDTQTTIGTNTTTATLEIRDAATLDVLATCTVTNQATVDT